MALAGELANTLVTRNSRANRTSQYLALRLRVTRKSACSRVQTPENEFANLSRGLFSYVTPSIVDCEWSSCECESRMSATLHLSGTVVYILFCIHLWIIGMVHMSSTKINKFLNTHLEARKCLTKMRKILRENDQNSKRLGRMTEDEIVWLFTQE